MTVGFRPALRHTAEPARLRAAWTLYRLMLVLVGIAWVCATFSLCGCARTNGWAMNKSGQRYYKKANYTAARFEFERALIDNPYNASYAHNVAKTMQQQGQLDDAERMYQHALALDPAHQPSYQALSQLLQHDGRDDEAYELLQAWADTQPYNAAAQVEMARAEQRDGNYQAAEQRLNAALQAKPRNPQALQQMGELQQQAGRPGLAAAFYRRSLSMNPYQPEVSARMGQLPYGPQPSSALHLANQMQRFDPSLAAGGGAIAGYRQRAPHQPMISSGGPMEMQFAEQGQMQFGQEMQGGWAMDGSAPQMMTHNSMMMPGPQLGGTQMAHGPMQMGGPMQMAGATGGMMMPGEWSASPSTPPGGMHPAQPMMNMPAPLPPMNGMMMGAGPMMGTPASATSMPFNMPAGMAPPMQGHWGSPMAGMPMQDAQGGGFMTTAPGVFDAPAMMVDGSGQMVPTQMAPSETLIGSPSQFSPSQFGNVMPAGAMMSPLPGNPAAPGASAQPADFQAFSNPEAAPAMSAAPIVQPF